MNKKQTEKNVLTVPEEEREGIVSLNLVGNNKNLLTIDNPSMVPAKMALNFQLQEMVNKAVSTGSMEGTVTLKISMDIGEDIDKETGVIVKKPKIKYKATSSVPMKSDLDGKMMGNYSMARDVDGNWMLADNQISMDELM